MNKRVYNKLVKQPVMNNRKAWSRYLDGDTKGWLNGNGVYITIIGAERDYLKNMLQFLKSRKLGPKLQAAISKELINLKGDKQ